MPKRVYRESGVSAETVKLGISARRASVSSVVGILSNYIREAFVSSGFPGFPKEAMQFFRGLARNNNRDWFQPRKPVFEEQVKRPMYELVDAVNTAMKRFAPDYVTDPAKAVYRIYR